MCFVHIIDYLVIKFNEVMTCYNTDAYGKYYTKLQKLNVKRSQAGKFGFRLESVCGGGSVGLRSQLLCNLRQKDHKFKACLIYKSKS